MALDGPPLMFTTRFAPAPTGFLHLGHIVNAIFVWGTARVWNGRVLLRVEDHDRQRSRPEYERAILEDLEWLGFVPDDAPVRQSDRALLYESALTQLRERGLVYACDCSRLSLPPPGEGAEARYPGTCREKNLPERTGAAVRIRLADSTIQFEDVRHGGQLQRPVDQCGDLLARDRHGNWTYQFAVTVDDMLQEVTLVIRGDDLLTSTGRQIQLAGLLGREMPPVFLHHPLLMKTPTQKLSKSDGDTSIRSFRERGWTPQGVIGQAAWQIDLVDENCDVVVDEIPDLILRASRLWAKRPLFDR